MNGQETRPGSLALHRFASLTAAATFVLIFAGALVTSTGSALSVPDWPLSYGKLMPPMVGGVRFEHSHRLIAGSVAILMLILAIWLAWREPRRWVRGLGFAALGAVFLQALLGGITVLRLLPHAISVAHACLGQTFFCLVVSIALVTSPRWQRESPAASDDPMLRDRRLVARLAIFTVATVYVQLILGAVMRHTNSGLAIPDFPLAFGHLLPPTWSGPVAIHFAHRLWALVVTGAVAAFVATIVKSPGLRPALWRPATLLAALIPAQITLGAVTVLSQKQAVATSAHVATGALILVTSLVLAIRASQHAQPHGGALPVLAADSLASLMKSPG